MINLLKIRILLIKELRERKRRLITAFVLLSAISGLFFIPRFYGSDDHFRDVIMKLMSQYQGSYPSVMEVQLLLIIYTDIFFQVFILVPAITSPFLGVLDSIINEKENRTLEGLLSLPISDSEVLMGKMSASMFAGIGLVWLMFIVHIIFFIIGHADFLSFHLLSAKWVVMVLIFSPSISFTVNTIGVILAIWLKKLNTAGNLGIFILSPFYLFVFLILFGQIVLDLYLILLLSIICLILGGVLFFAATRMFNRQNLLLRY